MRLEENGKLHNIKDGELESLDYDANRTTKHIPKSHFLVGLEMLSQQQTMRKYH